jgi:hypothetical protein
MYPRQYLQLSHEVEYEQIILKIIFDRVRGVWIVFNQLRKVSSGEIL